MSSEKCCISYVPASMSDEQQECWKFPEILRNICIVKFPIAMQHYTRVPSDGMHHRNLSKRTFEEDFTKSSSFIRVGVRISLTAQTMVEVDIYQTL